MVAGCGWNCPTVRNAVAPVALLPRGAGVFEIETTTGAAARRPGEGDLHTVNVINIVCLHLSLRFTLEVLLLAVFLHSRLL